MKTRSILRSIRDWRERARKATYNAAALAKLCHVSPRTLRRFFHDELRTSLRVWLKRMRIRDAKAQLRPGVQIKEVAWNAGYRRAEHFSRQFTLMCGVPPTAWMAQQIRA